MVFGIIPEYRSASLRNKRSASPESPGATVLFEWQFSRLPNGRTRLRQHIVLKGENAAEYLAEMQQAFTSNIAEGMRKVASAIDQANAIRC